MKAVLYLAMIFLTACATTGGLSHTGVALINNHKEAGFAVSGTSGTKVGKACSENWFGVITLGDSTIDEAMRAGGITKLSHVDHDYFKAIFFGRFCIIAVGE